jgi:acetylornithine deacetylase/succinyl-diaminopimelate desuccinylase-like protein
MARGVGYVAYRSFLHEARKRHIDELCEFLQIPSISALAEHKGDCRRASEWLVSRLHAAGLENAQAFTTRGNPIVYADWLHAPGAPTILVYGHYDVQPVDPLELWETPPFRPAVRNRRLYARGVSDDKGQIMVHIQALEAILKSEGALPVNVRVLLEGEEEVGSPNLGPFIRTHSDLLQSDVLLVSDTGLVAHNVPTLCCGLRGITTLEVDIFGARTDLHSGIYGGAVANPLQVLAQLLASLHGPDGRVRVPGFYDTVVELSEAERKQFAAHYADEAELAERLGVGAFVGEEGYSAGERMSIRPTLEINGLFGGFQGEGVKTVIPAEAHAKISCRLVPDQDPDDIVRRIADHLHQTCPPYMQLETRVGHGGRPWACDPSAPVLQAAKRALEAAFGRPVAFVRMGGSIPIMNVFTAVLQAPIVLMGFAAPDDNAHAPNENFPLDTYELALKASCLTWHEYGNMR